MRRATKCRQPEGQPSTQRENHGRVIAHTWTERWRGSQSKAAVRAAPNWTVANVAPRRISISSWRNSLAWGHLPIAYGEQDLSAQFVERRGSTAQLEWGPIEVGQGRSKGQAGASLASRAIRRVGKFRCPHSEP